MTQRPDNIHLGENDKSRWNRLHQQRLLLPVTSRRWNAMCARVAYTQHRQVHLYSHIVKMCVTGNILFAKTRDLPPTGRARCRDYRQKRGWLFLIFQCIFAILALLPTNGSGMSMTEKHEAQHVWSLLKGAGGAVPNLQIELLNIRPTAQPVEIP